MRDDTAVNESRARHWAIKPEVDSFTFERFVECMADIAESIKVINEECSLGQLTPDSLNRAARNISVAVRKAMLDGNGYLFKECVQPMLHPLKGARKRPRRGLRPEVLVERLGGMSIGYTVGDSDEQKAFEAPAYEHRTVVNPLHGLRRTGKKQYRLDDLFDWDGNPMRYSRWMKLKVLEVGGTVLSAERVLRLLATYEGAHVKSDPMTRSSASLPVDVKLSDDMDELYRKGNWVTFGGVSYLHIFTFLFGVYLARMMRETLKHVPKSAGQHIQSSSLWGPLLQRAPRIPSPTLFLDKQFNIGMVLQATGDPRHGFELVGNPEKPGVTTIQIPEGQ